MMAEPWRIKWLAGDNPGTGVLLPGWQGNLMPADAGLVHATMLPAPLDRVLQPLLTAALLELKQQVEPALMYCGGSPIPLEQLLAILRLRLTGIVTLPLGLMCQDAQVQGAEGALVRDLSTRAWTECLARFPLLTPLITDAMRGWIRGTEVFLRRLNRDGARMARWLGVASLPPIRALAGAGSDVHDGGHVVLRVSFVFGRELYYKPRPVTGEFLWHALLADLATYAPECSLPAARVLPGTPDSSGADGAGHSVDGDLASGYGWMEALPPHAVGARDRYWRAAGALLCVTQHLALTDLHAENVVPQETGPAVVDAECLGNAAGSYGTGGDAASGQALDQMLATGLLGPGLALHGPRDDNAPCAVSGLFARAAPIPSLRLPCWQLTMGALPQLDFAPAYLRLQHALPEQISALAVLPYLREGYQTAARALMACRSRLLANEGWLDTLERVHTPRVLVRTTLEYALVLSRSLFPDYLECMHTRRKALRALLEASPHMLGAGILPGAVTEAEIEALLQLDLPRFTLRSKAVSELERSISLPLSGAEAPATEIRRRLEALSEERLEAIYLPALTLACLLARG